MRTKFTERVAGRSRKCGGSRRSNRSVRHPQDGSTRRRGRRETPLRSRSVGRQRPPSNGRPGSGLQSRRARAGGSWEDAYSRHRGMKRRRPLHPNLAGLPAEPVPQPFPLRRRHRAGRHRARPEGRPRQGRRRGRRHPSRSGVREERVRRIHRHRRVNKPRRSRDGGTSHRRRICRG